MSALQAAKQQIAAKQAAKATNSNTNDKPKAKIWVNVGVETELGFIKLPYGLPLDTMPSSTDEYDPDKTWLMNALLEDLLEGCKNIPRGVDINPDELFTDLKLVVRVYHSKQVETQMSESERNEVRKAWKK